MNTIEITKEMMTSFDYEGIKLCLTQLEEQAIKNKGTLNIRFPEFEENTVEPLFTNPFIQGWYMGLLYNTPQLLYYLSDTKVKGRQWTDVQFAIMMFSTIKITANNEKEMSFEVIMDDETFQGLVQNTADYILKVNGRTHLTKDEQDFFTHIIFDYTNGFYA